MIYRGEYVNNNWNNLQGGLCSRAAPIIVYIFASVYHTLMISPQFHILEVIVWPTVSFVQLHLLMMDQGGPKHLGVL